MGIDKVVEAAKAYISRIESEIAKDPAIKPWDEYYILKEALYPPPARPSKEECINKLERYLVEYMHDDVFKSLAKDMLYYLKEPSLQWVKNTGVEPEYKVVVVRFRAGEICCFFSKVNLRWGCISSDDEVADNDVIEYIVLE